MARRPGTAAPPAQPAAAVPFAAASHEHTEPVATTTDTPGATVANKGPFDVPPIGYLRNLLFMVTTSGGVAGPGVLAADAPWNVLQDILLSDVNGAEIFHLDGYSALHANINNGYAFVNDPRQAPFSAETSVAAFAFFLRIPVELNRTGLGALPNQSAAAAYKLRYNINTAALLHSTAVTTEPAVTVKTVLEAWTLPAAQDMLGRPQQQLTPNAGTTQFWSKSSFTVPANALLVRLQRVGNYLRSLIFVSRDSTGARTDNVFPTTPQLSWDTRELFLHDQNVQTLYMFEWTRFKSRDTGVFYYDFDHPFQANGRTGGTDPSMWLATVEASRIELTGNNAATAGSIDVITNDVAVAATVPAQRFVETATGFEPTVGQHVPGAM